MQHERLNLSGDPVGLAQELRELIPAPDAVAEQVTEIIARVRASGDDALRYYTREYDTGGTTPAALRVPEAELNTDETRLDEAVRDGLRVAIDNVTRVAEAGLASEQSVAFEGHEVRLREVPVDLRWERLGGVFTPLAHEETRLLLATPARGATAKFAGR